MSSILSGLTQEVSRFSKNFSALLRLVTLEESIIVALCLFDLISVPRGARDIEIFGCWFIFSQHD